MATTAATFPTQSLPGKDHMVAAGPDPAGAGRRALWISVAGCFGLLGLVFASNLTHFVSMWQSDENYSHGFLVPLIAIYFARESARRGPIAYRPGVGLGLGMIAVSLLGKVATIAVPVGIVGDLSLLIGIAGICSLLAGTSALRRFAFALFFLVFMVPLPVALYTAIASPLQLTVSKIAAVLLNGGGIPVLRQGNMLTLPGDLKMFVAEACSGMRQLTGFLALTTAVAFHTARPAWYRGVLTASAIPIAMTANIIRVLCTALIMYYVDPKYASGSFHTIEGLLMMGLGLLLLAGECRLLSGISADTAPAEAPEEAAVAASPAASVAAAVPWRAALGVVLLAAGLAAEAGVERATATTRPPLSRPLAAIPYTLGDWVGRDVPVDAEVLRQSQADDFLNRVYEDPRHPGRRVSVWMNYSTHGLNLRHSPEVCLPSGGWTKVESQCRVLSIPRREGAAAAPMTRLAYSQGELVQGVAFWYYIFGEGEVERFVRSLPITSRSSHGRTTRGSGLTVEVFCPGEADPDGEVARNFAGALLDALEPLLPEDRAHYFVP